MINKSAVFLAAILAGTGVNAGDRAESAGSEAYIEAAQTRQDSSDRAVSSGTVVVSSLPLSVTLTPPKPTAPEMVLKLDNGGYAYLEGF